LVETIGGHDFTLRRTTPGHGSEATRWRALLQSWRPGRRRREITAAPLRDAPLIVRASAQSIDQLLFWKEAQQTMAGLSSNSRLIVAPCGHAVHFEQPALVVESIRLVVDAARTGQPLQP
jgi:pimeloyl-ACP methyl ester carboxylesterase